MIISKLSTEQETWYRTSIALSVGYVLDDWQIVLRPGVTVSVFEVGETFSSRKASRKMSTRGAKPGQNQDMDLEVVCGNFAPTGTKAMSYETVQCQYCGRVGRRSG
jgi:hypothetical protein